MLYVGKTSGMSCVVIEYARSGWSGGLGDRVVGLCSAISLARALEKQLLIKWDYPSLDGIVDLGIYNYYKSPVSLTTAVTLDVIDDRFKYETLLSTQPLATMWRTSTILLRCNQDLSEFLYRNATLSVQCPPENHARDMRLVYQRIFTEYLRPVKSVDMQSIEHPYLAVQLRTGDAYMNLGTHRPVTNVALAVKTLARYITKDLAHYQRVYVTSDNATAVGALQRLLPNRTVLSDARSVVHLERSSATSDQLSHLLADMITLTRASQLIVSLHSNYGRVAALANSSSQHPVLGFTAPSTVAPVDFAQLFTKHPARPHSAAPPQKNPRIIARPQPQRLRILQSAAPHFLPQPHAVSPQQRKSRLIAALRQRRKLPLRPPGPVPAPVNAEISFLTRAFNGNIPPLTLPRLLTPVPPAWPTHIPVYVISIRPERLAAFARRFPHPFRHWPGTNGSVLSRTKPLSTLRPGEIGCFDSHRRLWTHIAQQDQELAIICEDDVNLVASPEQCNYLDMLLREVETRQYDALFLSWFRPRPDASLPPPPSAHTRMQWTFCQLWCYLVTKRGAQRMVDCIQTMRQPVDVALDTARCLNQLSNLVAYPPLCLTVGARSDTANRFY